MHDAPWLLGRLRTEGFAFVEAEPMRAQLSALGPLTDWDAFTASWDHLGLDTFMADHGRYRRRRHAVYSADANGIMRLPHRPHYQAREYNSLNGGIARWFDPVLPEIAAGASLQTILAFCHRLFGALAPAVPAWEVEAHQFRIEAGPGVPGQPTPEGVHRDGVDYALVLLVRRQNIASGVTSIHRPDGAALGEFTLAHPFESALVDDARVLHGVTAVEPLDPAAPAFRDVLVVTFRRAP